MDVKYIIKANGLIILLKKSNSLSPLNTGFKSVYIAYIPIDNAITNQVTANQKKDLATYVRNLLDVSKMLLLLCPINAEFYSVTCFNSLYVTR